MKTLLFYISVPLIVWFAAFLIWFYWNDLMAVLTRDQRKGSPVPKIIRRIEPGDKSQPAPANRPQEKILDEDRKKLEDILKRKS